jgi:hypothetical protein
MFFFCSLYFLKFELSLIPVSSQQRTNRLRRTHCAIKKEQKLLSSELSMTLSCRRALGDINPNIDPVKEDGYNDTTFKTTKQGRHRVRTDSDPVDFDQRLLSESLHHSPNPLLGNNDASTTVFEFLDQEVMAAASTASAMLSGYEVYSGGKELFDGTASTLTNDSINELGVNVYSIPYQYKDAFPLLNDAEEHAIPFKVNVEEKRVTLPQVQPVTVTKVSFNNSIFAEPQTLHGDNTYRCGSPSRLENEIFDSLRHVGSDPGDFDQMQIGGVFEDKVLDARFAKKPFHGMDGVIEDKCNINEVTIGVDGVFEDTSITSKVLLDVDGAFEDKEMYGCISIPPNSIHLFNFPIQVWDGSENDPVLYYLPKTATVAIPPMPPLPSMPPMLSWSPMPPQSNVVFQVRRDLSFFLNFLPIHYLIYAYL